MILSNFILFFTYQKNYRNNFLLQQKYFVNSNLVTKNCRKKSIQNLLVVSNKSSSNNLENLDNSFKNNKLITRNVFQKFFDAYSKETIFLSTSNKFVIEYVNKVKNMGLSTYDSSQYKSFISRFSKDLIQGKIEVSSSDSNKLLARDINNKKHISIEYVWPKFFNSSNINVDYLKKNIMNIFCRTNLVSTNKSLPFFILVNSSNEIIMSESSDTLSNNLGNQLINRFYSNSSYKRNYTCLLFINYNDAVEYKNHILYKNKKSTNLVNIKVIPCNINLYFKLKEYYRKTVNFCLVPDLKEISNLLNRYAKYKNVSFHFHQKYGHNFFQGQPTYQIESSNLKNNSKLLSDSKSISFFKKYNHTNICFLNYQMAINAWQLLLKENSELDLPNNPKIVVSNLEYVIKEKRNTSFLNNLLFLPSLDNYIFIKEYLQVNFKDEYSLKNWLCNQHTYLKTVCCRIFWSVTSRQPNSW